jgi:tetratricopeptide (TPR) repeat protein
MKKQLIFFLIIITNSLFARGVDDGEVLFNNKQYLKARVIYENLLKQKPNDALYNYRYARCCYELKDAETAIIHFEMAGSKYPQRDLYLGELYFKTYRFDKAVMAYQSYIASLKPDDVKLPEYQAKVVQSEKCARLLSKVEDIAIVDSLVVGKNEFLKFYKFSNELGTINQELLKLTARRSVDKIIYTTQRKDRIYYSDSIHGQMDIFTSFKLLDSWTPSVSVSNAINTKANENYPFLLLDGITLYFASDGENSIGGYDLFVTRYTPSTETFLAPENLGFPFNSPANDYMMVIDEQRKLGWFATDRNQPTGKVLIYTFVPNASKTIIRTEDNDYLRNVAQLKLYRKSNKTVLESSNNTTDKLQDSNIQMEFIINDSVVYKHSKEFKNVEAINLWNELNKSEIELKNSKLTLNNLQQEFSNEAIIEKRNLLSPQILDLELKIRNLEKLIKSKIIEVRNAENKYLKMKL